MRAIEETERVLRGSRYLYDAVLKPVAYRDGVVDIEVATRDTWTVDLGLSAGRTGGTNTSGWRISDHNVFGAGTTLSIGRSNDVDRSSNFFQFTNERAFGGWSEGLIDGWVRRTSVGIQMQDDALALEPGRVAPAELPADEKRDGPFVRYECIEDRYLKAENRNLIGRPEYFDLGLAATLQLGWASTSLGSSLDALLYWARVSRGFEPGPAHTLMTSASLAGRLVDGRVSRQTLGARADYFRPQGRHWLFYASASGQLLSAPGAQDELLLGGEEGLRGYPLRYQSGTRRALFTVEERFYTSVFLWQLFRIGGAAFYDVGPAWGGGNVNVANPGWLSNVGAGLRIVSSRAAFSTVVHLDVAVPLQGTPDMDKVQFLVTTKSSF